MLTFYLVLVALAGALIATQSGVNAQLARATGHPVFAATSAWLAPVLGAATLVSVAVAGQMAFALVLDHYGLVGFPVRSMSAGRAVGAGLLVMGVVLIRKC